ncbi:hypothetical protein NC651_006636 [Populus alba x Populus x berolinensis]|nr:hypothetical protein NC651_006636 [Populus alba x Populus x berolinensis]
MSTASLAIPINSSQIKSCKMLLIQISTNFWPFVEHEQYQHQIKEQKLILNVTCTRVLDVSTLQLGYLACTWDLKRSNCSIMQ